MDDIREKGKSHESVANRSRRSCRPRKLTNRRRSKVLQQNQDGGRKLQPLESQNVPSKFPNRSSHKHDRGLSISSERQRKRIAVVNEEHEQAMKRHLNRHRRRSRDRDLSSASNTSVDLHRSRSNSDAHTGVVSEEDEFMHKRNRKHTKETLSSKKRSPRSSSTHDDSVGHYPIRTGEIIGDGYKILREVGLGTFGRVVECIHMQNRNQDCGRRSSHEPNRYVAIKIVRNVKRYYESAVLEARIISEANRRGGRGRTHCVILHDTFRIDGHFCMVFEKLGPSLYDFLKRNRYTPFPTVCVQDFTVQLLEAVEFFHSYRLIHTDLKIENILLMNDREIIYRNQKVPESTRIKIIDFGGACYDTGKKSSIINTRQYRAPEVILGVGWSMPSDMWSVGCILSELYCGELLFATHDNVEHLALIERKIGRFPRRMVNASKEGQDPELARVAFDSAGRHLQSRALTHEQYAFVRKAQPLENQIRSEDAWFLHLLRRILVIDPHERATAYESLQYLHRIRRDVVRCA